MLWDLTASFKVALHITTAVSRRLLVLTLLIPMPSCLIFQICHQACHKIRHIAKQDAEMVHSDGMMPDQVTRADAARGGVTKLCHLGYDLTTDATDATDWHVPQRTAEEIPVGLPLLVYVFQHLLKQLLWP